MTDPNPNGPAPSPAREDGGKIVAPPSSASDEVGGVGSAPTSTQELTAEEQMALYEKELKENDWGHQPC